MEIPELLKGLLIALTASGITLGTHQLFVAPDEPRMVDAVPTRGGTPPGVESALARLEALLEHQSPQLVGSSSLAEIPAIRRVAAGPPSAPVEIQKILERLTAIERKLTMRPAIERELQPLDRLRAPDVLAIRAAIDLRKVDREASEFDLRMRTMHEIVERFGYPSKAAACGNDSCEVYWKYELPSVDPGNPNYFCLYFTGGLVVWAESRWTD